MTKTQKAPLLKDSLDELLYARTWSATSKHYPKPENPERTLCGGKVMLLSEFEEHGKLHRCAPSSIVNLPLCERCEKSAAKR